MVNDATISVIALAVALVALITTISQVLGQFLAIADGYRRCQPSVMGQWAKMTQRRFRWSELRFETLYTVPKFGLFPYMPGRLLSRETDVRGTTTPHFQLDGSPYAMKATYCELSTHDITNALASWVKLIEALHGNSREVLRRFPSRTAESDGILIVKSSEKPVEQTFGPSIHLIPDIKMQQRSWYFVPPEVVRPLAVISLADIAILARRLGMVWKQFEPTDGNLRAEGNGHTISSTVVRSMGTVLQIGFRDPLPYTYDLDDLNELYIPSEAADKMGFGIVPGIPALNVPDYKLGTEDEVLATLRNVVDPSHQAAEHVKGIKEANPGWTPGISDIIGFATPMIRQPGSSLVRVPAPAGYSVGLFQQQEGFIVFRNRLKDLIAERDEKGKAVSVRTRAIFEQYEELRHRYGDLWEDQLVCDKIMNNRSVEFLDDLHARHDATTDYFKSLVAERSGLYTEPLYSHIRHAVNYFPNALERLNAKPSRARDHYGLRVAGWIAEGAHILFDNMTKIVSDMRDNGYDDAELIEEAWLTMVFRAFLWHRCHFVVEGPRVPSSHWGSKLPVYIG